MNNVDGVSRYNISETIPPPPTAIKYTKNIYSR